MKKQKISKYRLMSVVVLALMFFLFMKNTSAEGKGIFEVLIPLFFYLGSAVFFLAGPGLEKKEEEKKRREEFKKAYPEFALKMSMLIQAGFAPKAALEKIGKSYLQRKTQQKGKANLFYEEILCTLREMQSGTAETEAYERLGKRSRLMEMVRLCGLMIRNVKRGSGGLADELKEESRRALNARQEMVKKRGEVAGTKLLFPMMLFLLIVMVIILYPGFVTIAGL